MGVFVGPVPAVVGLVANLPLADAASVPTLELIGSTRRALCGRGGGDGVSRFTSRSALTLLVIAVAKYTMFIKGFYSSVITCNRLLTSKLDV